MRGSIPSLVLAAAGVMVLVAGVSKAVGWPDLPTVMKAHRVIPQAWASPVAVLVIAGETLAGFGAIIAVSSGRAARHAAWVLALAMAAFTAYSVLAASRAPDSSCGCGLPLESGWGWVIARNTATLAVLAWAIPRLRSATVIPTPGGSPSSAACV